MKKYALCLRILILSFGLFSACGKKLTAYTYENEAVLGIKIEKAEVYENKFVVTFAKDSLSGVKKAECYSADLSVIEEEPGFSWKKDVLTIKTDHADRISGIKVWDSNRDVYFYVRYMDSDSYAMLVYSWADDVGYMVSGDEDAYFTQEEKEAQNKSAESQAEAETLTYSKLLGEWINESGDTCIVFDDNGDDRYFSVYELAGDEWGEVETMYVSDLSEQESDEGTKITLYDNQEWGRAVFFSISDEDAGMKCLYADDKFEKVK